MQAGAIGVTGSTAANGLAHDADIVVALGTRLSDFTTGSHALLGDAAIVSVNVQPFDALKMRPGAIVVGAVARTLANGLWLLGIPAPEKM